MKIPRSHSSYEHRLSTAGSVFVYQIGNKQQFMLNAADVRMMQRLYATQVKSHGVGYPGNAIFHVCCFIYFNVSLGEFLN